MSDLSLDLLEEAPPLWDDIYWTEDRKTTFSLLVEESLADFGINAELVDVRPGPVVTILELRHAPGVKASQIASLSNDLARVLRVRRVTVGMVAETDAISLEIANENRQMVALKEIIQSLPYKDMSSPLAVALGKDIGGKPFVKDLAAMPHVLIAGTTGSGKSVMINAMIVSLLYKARPEEVRFILIDPKIVELSLYDDIPHLLAPVVTDMRRAANALGWCVREVERRYNVLDRLGVRNIGAYNSKVKKAFAAGRPPGDPTVAELPLLVPLPHIVIIIDDLADLRMTVGRKTDELIERLTQKGRAAGVHLVLTSQTVDLITGEIKDNIPCRMAFQVPTRADSRSILGRGGAETLEGHGDMLYLSDSTAVPVRVHGAFVSDEEVRKVADMLRSMGEPRYIEDIVQEPVLEESESPPAPAEPAEDVDERYEDAVRIVTTDRKASISYVQRKLKIGYNRAARLLEKMEEDGLVSSLQSNGQREVLAQVLSDDGDLLPTRSTPRRKRLWFWPW